MSYGRYLHEIEIGQTFKHWPGRTITEFDDTLFSLLSMNLHPVHIDEHYARGTVFERRPVIDSSIFSLRTGMSVAETSGKTIANLGFEIVSFESPMYAGDSLYGESEVLDKRESASKPDRGI